MKISCITVVEGERDEDGVDEGDDDAVTVGVCDIVGVDEGADEALAVGVRDEDGVVEGEFDTIAVGTDVSTFVGSEAYAVLHNNETVTRITCKRR
jgi:hypothetical protein